MDTGVRDNETGIKKLKSLSADCCKYTSQALVRVRDLITGYV